MLVMIVCRREEEVDGADYHFISRLQFEQDILARFNIANNITIIIITINNNIIIINTAIVTLNIRKFVEHSEYEKQT